MGGSATPELDITWLQSSRVLRSEQVLRPKSAALTSTLRPRWPCLGKVDFNLAGLRSPMWATSMLGKLVGAIADTIKGFIIPLIEGPIRDILQNIINGMMPPTALMMA